MTIEKICFVRPEDIKAIRITCTACSASTIVPLKEALNVGVFLAKNCGACGSQTSFRQDTQEWKDLVLLGERLQKLPDMMKSRSITYSIQIECPKE
jgi:hypothetical protein